ncbi:hypothetical protein BBJ28_00022199 [Nothophytophthora sp. Chile5]|nr:hypothetical protein BBJ28_00022199 [Nothophytophthora sp. Chile5]
MELARPVYERRLRQRGRTVVERSASEDVVNTHGDETSTTSDHLAGGLYDDAEPTKGQDEADEGEEAEWEDGDEQPVAAYPVVTQTTPSRQSNKCDQVERALLTICAQRTQTVEQSIADFEDRLRVALEEVDLRLVSTPVPSFEEDPMAHKYLTLRRQQAMQRLKAEIAASGNASERVMYE